MTQFESPKFNSKANNKKYEDNYDKIFRKKTKDTKKVRRNNALTFSELIEELYYVDEVTLIRNTRHYIRRFS
jgi:hypothetical protein